MLLSPPLGLHATQPTPLKLRGVAVPAMPPARSPTEQLMLLPQPAGGHDHWNLQHPGHRGRQDRGLLHHHLRPGCVARTCCKLAAPTLPSPRAALHRQPSGVRHAEANTGPHSPAARVAPLRRRALAALTHVIRGRVALDSQAAAPSPPLAPFPITPAANSTRPLWAAPAATPVPAAGSPHTCVQVPSSAARVLASWQSQSWWRLRARWQDGASSCNAPQSKAATFT